MKQRGAISKHKISVGNAIKHLEHCHCFVAPGESLVRNTNSNQLCLGLKLYLLLNSHLEQYISYKAVIAL